MRCPFCDAEDTRVADSRLVDDGGKVRRRRVCQGCNERFTTFELIDLTLPRVVKSDGVREAYNQDKIRTGILRALEKRPVSTEDVDKALANIKKRMMFLGEKEVQARQIGEWVMHELRQLDEVAYVRFASVYRSFQDVNAFREMIEKLENETVMGSQKDQLQLLPAKKNSDV